MSTDHALVRAYGGWAQCIAVLEQTTKVSQLIRISTVIDSEFGDGTASSASWLSPTHDFMTRAVETNSKELCALSGYAHLLLAEKMHRQNFDKASINRELEKAEALLDFAHLGGRHPWLPRAQRLRRRLNLGDYLRLGGAVISILVLLIAIGGLYRYVRTSDIAFF